MKPLASSLVDHLRRARFLALDFDGVFTDNGVYVLDDGREMVRCSRADGLGVANLRRLGMPMMVLSSEVNPVVTARCRKLGLPVQQGLEDKAGALGQALAEASVPWDQAAFLGNDTNDAECLRRVGLACVVQDAHPDVIALAEYRTHAPGGHGAVRELCDLFSLHGTFPSR